MDKMHHNYFLRCWGARGP